MKIVALGLTAVLLGSCAAQPSAVPPASSSPSAASAIQVVVPQLLTMSVSEIDRTMAKVGLVAIIRYEPAILTEKGTVAGVEPAPGTRLPRGGEVTVIVAGDHGPRLQDYVDAHREAFVGLGADTGGVLVVAIHSGAEMTKFLGPIGKLAEGKSYRVQPCAHTWADLQRVQLELARREFSPDAASLNFATAVDPLACKLRLTANLPDSVIAVLTAKYPDALVIQTGGGQ